MEKAIHSFVESLGQFDSTISNHPIQNPYEKENCRYNLENYLLHVAKHGSGIMLVGEAPGYRGCQLTGIPFTDEKQLISPDNYFGLGKWKRHPDTSDTSEISANVIWEGLRNTKIIPLMWNAFPFHPYKAGNIQSNRKPTQAEIDFGLQQLQILCEMFNIDSSNIYAIGRTAQKQLKLNDDHYIRHPANGGKQKCLAMIERLV